AVHAVSTSQVGERLQQDLGTQLLRRRATLGVTHWLASASRSTAALTERAVILHGLKETLDGLTRSRGVLLEERDQVAIPDDVPALDALPGEEDGQSHGHLHGGRDVLVRTRVPALNQRLVTCLQSLLECQQAIQERLRQSVRNPCAGRGRPHLGVRQRGDALGQRRPQLGGAVLQQHRPRLWRYRRQQVVDRKIVLL